MTLSELLRSAIAALPRPPRTLPFREALQEVCTAYLDAIRNLTGDDSASAYARSRSDLIARIASNVAEVHHHALNGQPSHARRLLDETLKDAAEDIRALISIPVVPEHNQFLFRMRRATSIPALDRKGLFHIPFDRRHLVGPQRYSVPGLPMLYLGSSLLVCWHEIGCPPLNEVWISRFEPRADLRVLNFGYPPDLVGLWIANHMDAAPNSVAEYAGSYAVLWPLQAACSFRAAYRGSPFVEEYVVPQLLTGWLSEQESGSIDGIRYFSTHLERATPGLCMNYVFVPREVTDQGHCATLSAKFALSEPILWDYAAHVRSPVTAADNEDRGESLYNGEPKPVNYSWTAWGEMESQLRRHIREPIDR